MTSIVQEEEAKQAEATKADVNKPATPYGDGDKDHHEHTRCFPSFLPKSPKYFNSLSPFTKTHIGDENYAGALTVMREKFPGNADYDMVPFLRITNGNVEQAANIYSQTIAWRTEFLPVSKESCISQLNKGMFFFHGSDLEGRPVGYLTMRGHDPKHRDLDECLRSLVYRCEELKTKMPEKEWQVTIILDRNGTTQKNSDQDMMKQFFALFAEKYPNKLNKVLVVPANLIFRTMWSALKYTMNERIRNKVVMLSSEKELKAYIASDQLLTSVGGQSTYDFRTDL